MGALRKGRSNKSKNKRTPSSNPYSDRGLDKFALVSAELTAKREELSAKMGTPLSVVRFAIGSHSNWVPIIVSSSHSSRRALHALAAAKADHKHGDSTAVVVAGATGRRQQQGSLPCPPWDRGKMQKEAIGHGMPYSIKEDDRDNLTQHDDVEEIASFDNGIDNVDSRSRDIQAAKFVSLRMSLEAALANFLVILKAHRRPSVDKVEDIDASADKPIKDDRALSTPTLQDVHLLPPPTSAKAAPRPSEESLALPALPPVRITPTAKLSDDGAETEDETLKTSSMEAAMSNLGPTKHRSRLKRCPLRKESSSAPSTPRDSRQPKPKTPAAGQSHPTASAIETKSSFKFPSWRPHNDHLNAKGDHTPRRRSHLKDQIDRVDNKEAKMHLNDLLKGLGANTEFSDARTIAKKDSLKRVGMSASNSKGIGSATIEQKRAERLGQALTLVGPVLVLGGLVTGYMAAIAAVVCWWYALPRLRRAVGDKPFVRSHHHLHNHVGTATASTSNVAMKTSSVADVSHAKKKKKVLTEVGSGKYDLQSSQYKKKVIMDGLLDRGLHTKT